MTMHACRDHVAAMWLEYISDEAEKVHNKYTYDKLVALFEQAVADYIGVRVQLRS